MGCDDETFARGYSRWWRLKRARAFRLEWFRSTAQDAYGLRHVMTVKGAGNGARCIGAVLAPCATTEHANRQAATGGVGLQRSDGIQGRNDWGDTRGGYCGLMELPLL
jgi:hypothetical protein